MAFGIIVGLHPWDSGKHLDSVGSVFGNASSGAVIIFKSRQTAEELLQVR
jgi:hypothetical protein